MNKFFYDYFISPFKHKETVISLVLAMCFSIINFYIKFNFIKNELYIFFINSLTTIFYLIFSSLYAYHISYIKSKYFIVIKTILTPIHGFIQVFGRFYFSYLYFYYLLREDEQIQENDLFFTIIKIRLDVDELKKLIIQNYDNLSKYDFRSTLKYEKFERLSKNLNELRKEYVNEFEEFNKIIKTTYLENLSFFTEKEIFLLDKFCLYSSEFYEIIKNDRPIGQYMEIVEEFIDNLFKVIELFQIYAKRASLFNVNYLFALGGFPIYSKDLERKIIDKLFIEKLLNSNIDIELENADTHYNIKSKKESEGR